MRLLLIRHGDAHAGLTGTIAGPRGCAGLTDVGRAQAALLGQRLHAETWRPDVVVASELPRAIETARLATAAIDVDRIGLDCGLCEVHVGEADGRDWAEFLAAHGGFDMAAEPDRLFAPGGDSWQSFHSRVDDTMQRLAAEHAGQTVLAFCHAGVIAASLRVRFGTPGQSPGIELRPTNTGITEWTWEPGPSRWRLISYDDAAHLA